MKISKKLITFSECFAPFLKSASIFEQFENNISLTALIFPKLPSVKNVFT